MEWKVYSIDSGKTGSSCFFCDTSLDEMAEFYFPSMHWIGNHYTGDDEALGGHFYEKFNLCPKCKMRGKGEEWINQNLHKIPKDVEYPTTTPHVKQKEKHELCIRRQWNSYMVGC